METKTDTADTTNQGNQWEQSIPTSADRRGMLGRNLLRAQHSRRRTARPALWDTRLPVPAHWCYMFANQQIRPWKLSWPDGSSPVFRGLHLDASRRSSDPNGKMLMSTMKLHITGNIFYVD